VLVDYPSETVPRNGSFSTTSPSAGLALLGPGGPATTDPKYGLGIPEGADEMTVTVPRKGELDFPAGGFDNTRALPRNVVLAPPPPPEPPPEIAAVKEYASTRTVPSNSVLLAMSVSAAARLLDAATNWPWPAERAQAYPFPLIAP
jgi:hypothetical protein